MTDIKITKLTAPNVRALEEMIEATGTRKVTVARTTATFHVDNAVQALDIVTEFQRVAVAQHGATGHPNASLHAVRRKVEALVAAEKDAEEFTRAESAKVEAMRDSGTLAQDLATAKRRAEERAEQDAANDPLVKLIEDAEPLIARTVGTTTPDPATGLTVGAAIRPKAWVTAYVADEPSAERKFRTRPGSRVAGRLLPASKCRRNRRR